MSIKTTEFILFLKKYHVKRAKTKKIQKLLVEVPIWTHEFEVNFMSLQYTVESLSTMEPSAVTLGYYPLDNIHYIISTIYYPLDKLSCFCNVVWLPL